MIKDKKLLSIIIAVSIVFLIVIGTSIFYLGVNKRFSTFIGKVNHSTATVYNKDCLYAETSGHKYKIVKDNIYPIYSWLIVAGPGKEKLFEIDNLEEYILLDYGRSTYLILGNYNDELYVCYKNVNYKHIFISNTINFKKFYDCLLSADVN